MKKFVVWLALVIYSTGNTIEYTGLVDVFDDRGGLIELSNPVTRIIGGQVTTIETFPYIVSLQRLGQHSCGGSIISVSRILTAAHCTYGVTRSVLQIESGSTVIGSGLGQVKRISKIVNHPNYNSRTITNDVSVLHLDGPLALGSGVQPVPLPRQGARIATGANAVVAGWGIQRMNGEVSKELRNVTVPIVSQTRCNIQYSGAIGAGMVCAGYIEGNRGFCQGDSGGPLTLNGQVIGIVSFFKGCGRVLYPGVYTRVPYYRRWIDSVL